MKKSGTWLSGFILLSAAAGAETMETRGIGPAPAGSPSNGMSMEQVVRRHGEPKERLAPVGEPPITRWIYPEYTVYFEHELVLTSVGNR